MSKVTNSQLENIPSAETPNLEPFPLTCTIDDDYRCSECLCQTFGMWVNSGELHYCYNCGARLVSTYE